MSESDPKDPKDKDLRPREKTSGRVAFDSRGNAVWEWKMKTGVFGRDVDTGRLKTLQAPDLEIAADPTTASSSPEEKKEAGKVAKAGGFDPYNSSAPASGSARGARHTAQPEEKPDKPGFFRRLFGKG